MILVFGTVCLDRVRQISSLPKPGGYAEVTREQVLLGGEATNTANALRVWGADVRLAGNPLGGGAEARLLHGLLQERRLDYAQPSSNPTLRTPVCDVYVTPDGERTMFGLGFSDMASHIDVEAVSYQCGEWFTAEPNFGQAARQAVKLATQKGMRVYLMDFFQENDPIVPGTFWQSSTDWVGERGNTARNLAWVEEWIVRHGCFTIVSDGPRGFVAGLPEWPVRAYPPFPSPAIVDPTGAGDLFRAGMLFGLDQIWPLERCLLFASAAGCLSVRGLGATTDVPTVEEIHALIKDHPAIAESYVAPGVSPIR